MQCLIYNHLRDYMYSSATSKKAMHSCITIYFNSHKETGGVAISDIVL